MARRRPAPQWIIITDHDREEFTVRGPITDDTETTNRVADLQKRGRQINCHTVPVERGVTREEVIRRYAEEMDGRFAFTEAELDAV